MSDQLNQSNNLDNVNAQIDDVVNKKLASLEADIIQFTSLVDLDGENEFYNRRYIDPYALQQAADKMNLYYEDLLKSLISFMNTINFSRDNVLDREGIIDHINLKLAELSYRIYSTLSDTAIIDMVLYKEILDIIFFDLDSQVDEKNLRIQGLIKNKLSVPIGEDESRDITFLSAETSGKERTKLRQQIAEIEKMKATAEKILYENLGFSSNRKILSSDSQRRLVKLISGHMKLDMEWGDLGLSRKDRIYFIFLFPLIIAGVNLGMSADDFAKHNYASIDALGYIYLYVAIIFFIVTVIGFSYPTIYIKYRERKYKNLLNSGLENLKLPPDRVKKKFTKEMLRDLDDGQFPEDFDMNPDSASLADLNISEG